MATSKRRKVVVPRKPPADAVAVKIVFEPSELVPTYYTNHLEIGRTAHEFTVMGGRIPGKMSQAAQDEATRTGQIALEPSFQLLIPPTLMHGLIGALQDQLSKWEEAFGPAERRRSSE